MRNYKLPVIIKVNERITETFTEQLMQIKEMAENMDYEVLRGIVDCLWVIGEPISVFKEAVEKFDAMYYRGLLQKAWEEAAFVFHG